MENTSPEASQLAMAAELAGDGEYARLSALLEAGDFSALRDAAGRFVERHPDHVRAFKLLGYACLVLQQPEAALEAFRRAAAGTSPDAETLDHLGCTYNMLGRYTEAAEAFERSVAVDDTRAETWGNLGKNRDDTGDRQAAVAPYRRAIALDPELVAARSNLGAILCELGQADEAIDILDEALRLAPDNIWVNVHRGNALKRLDRIPEAIAAFDHALKLDPKVFQAWLNLADVLQEVGDTSQAVSAAERAYAINPDFPEVLNTLGTLYAAADRRRDAETMLRQAVTLRPDDAVYWLNLGHACETVEEKIGCCRRALTLRPGFDQALSPLLFCLNYLSATTPSSMRAEALSYGRLLATRVVPRTQWSNERSPERPLRIGVVSGDLCQHPVSYFLESTLMAFRDKPHVWLAYSTVEKEDATTANYRSLFHEWRDSRTLSDEDLAERIVNDQVDILIDLAGHSAGHRLPVFAYKPAPVQVAWLGYFATTGLRTMDWIVADPWCVPAGEDANFTERVWRMPESRFCFTPPRLEAEIKPQIRAADEPQVLGCFNTLIKANDEVLELWSRVMAALPQAFLLIKAKQLGDEAACRALVERLVRFGFPVERVILESRSPRDEYLKTYHRIDFCLDTFPFTGGTTTAEALWMGVPVLTLKGATMIGRQGESMLHNVGLGDWVANDPNDYVRKAVEFANDYERLARLRRSLRDRGSASPLGNPVWFANQFETALRGMWRKYCNGETGPARSVEA